MIAEEALSKVTFKSKEYKYTTLYPLEHCATNMCRKKVFLEHLRGPRNERDWGYTMYTSGRLISGFSNNGRPFLSNKYITYTGGLVKEIKKGIPIYIFFNLYLCNGTCNIAGETSSLGTMNLFVLIAARSSSMA